MPQTPNQPLTQPEREMMVLLDAHARVPAGSINHLLHVTAQSREMFIDMLRRADDDQACQRFVAVWDQLTPDEQANVSFDDLARLINIRPSVLVGVFVEELCRFKQTLAAVRAALALEAVVEASLNAAKTLQGVEDRKIILRNQKFITDPKTQAITIDQRKVEVHTALPGGFEALIKGHLSPPQLVGPEALATTHTMEVIDVPADNNQTT